MTNIHYNSGDAKKRRAVRSRQPLRYVRLLRNLYFVSLCRKCRIARAHIIRPSSHAVAVNLTENIALSNLWAAELTVLFRLT